MMRSATATATADEWDQPGLPRFSLALVSGLHALVFGVAAAILPWRGGSVAAVALALMALMHVATALCALLQYRRGLWFAWRGLSLLSLLLLAVATVALLSSALYLAELYQGIGRAVAGALAGIWGLVVLFTVPVSCWGLARTGFRLRLASARGALLALGVTGAVLCVGFARTAAHALHVPLPEEAEVARSLQQVVSARAAAPPLDASLFHREPLLCPAPVDARRVTLFISYLGDDGRAHGECLQAPSWPPLAAALGSLLERQPTARVKLDVVHAVQRLAESHPLLDALKLRPGLDGACIDQRCVTPWQLVALDVFTSHRPLPAVKDMSFGFSPEAVAALLGRPSARFADLTRVETLSYLAEGGRLVPLRRLRAPRASVEPATLAHAVRAAEGHIVSAQLLDGSFRYLLNPLTGAQYGEAVSLPRQAGTTMVLCELGQDGRTPEVVRRALAWLAANERRSDELSLLSTTPHEGQLGSTALALSALLSCRGSAGTVHDVLIARLTRFLLRMQRPDGSFHPEYDLTQRRPLGRHESLYGGGQAVLALVLSEQQASTIQSPEQPKPAALRAAIDRAMQFYASHWPRALRDFFFLEENWHCLAARAALDSHRHDAYEQFCLDYVAFKTRLIQDDPAVPEFVGGYGLGNLFPPHFTATAGFGEALAAAIEIERRRGLDVAPRRALLRQVLAFLLRAQWDERSCFACMRQPFIPGAFSEHVASPIIRIDYVQHALAALGHGARALGGGR